jgi:hypothetical protein
MTDIEDKHKEEFFRIISLNNDELLKEFETLIKNGAGNGYIRLLWMRKEILKRM